MERLFEVIESSRDRATPTGSLVLASPRAPKSRVRKRKRPGGRGASASRPCTRKQARAALIGGGTHDAVEVDEREATILFTNLPEYLKRLEAEEDPAVFDRRQEYSELVTGIVAGHRGILHDYQADYLMVGFGTAVGQPDPQHAAEALGAARELLQSMSVLASMWPNASLSEVDISCGLCSGLVAVGYVGSRRHKQAPAAIGDTTNVAARLLVNARKQKLKLLLHERTRELLPADLPFVALPPVELKGKSKPVPIFTLESP